MLIAKQIKQVTYCEINTKLSEIVKHNYKILKTHNIACLNKDGIEVLKHNNKPVDWIYIDPSRRDNSKKKVFQLTDCTPNIKLFYNLFLQHAKHIMVKTSPLLDIKATLLQLKHVKEIHIVAVRNEVKELLWIIEQGFTSQVTVKTANLKKNTEQFLNFKLEEEINTKISYNQPLTYLYEPNSAILKSGAFNMVSKMLNIPKLHKHSHLYTSKSLITFPGRRFKIEKQLVYNKKLFVREKISKANITTRNFPLSVEEIRKKLKIKDGGIVYLFFTTNNKDKKIILICSKVS